MLIELSAMITMVWLVALAAKLRPAYAKIRSAKGR